MREIQNILKSYAKRTWMSVRDRTRCEGHKMSELGPTVVQTDVGLKKINQDGL